MLHVTCDVHSHADRDKFDTRARMILPDHIVAPDDVTDSEVWHSGSDILWGKIVTVGMHTIASTYNLWELSRLSPVVDMFMDLYTAHTMRERSYVEVSFTP